MNETFQKYRKATLTEARPFVPGESLDPRVTIGENDKATGSPKQGDMIARNPANHDDMWLIEASTFKSTYDPTPVDA